jgi:putative MATE family efflux protein
MQDLTKGSIGRHVLGLASFIALSTTFQTLYFLADLYFVGRLGKEAIAGVAVGGNLMMFVLALTQSLGVGTTSLVAQSLGHKDHERAELVFNQAMLLSVVTGLAFGVTAFVLRYAYSGWLAADAVTVALGVEYLDWFIPALVVQFPMVIIGAALAGQGETRIPALVQTGATVLNIALAPVLIFGLGSGRPLGVAGAALALFIALVAGCVALLIHVHARSPLKFSLAKAKPQFRLWGEMLGIGLPAGGEFALMFVYVILVYDIIRSFGAAAQAGFGIGGRVTQALFMPAVAIAFAAAPVVGQNFGARLGARVRATLYTAGGMSALVMVALTLLCQLAPDALVRLFSQEAAVIGFGSEYLRVISWAFVASGLVFVSSSVFQGMGNTLPALGGSALRVLCFAIPGYAMARQPGFELRHIWYLAVAAVTLQLCVNLFLLHRALERRLPVAPLSQGASGVLETESGTAAP